MSVNFKEHKNNFLFVPLGGSGEIGMNLNLYHLDGKWLIVDFGAGFADDYLPGVDLIVPDISFLIKQKDNIIGMILTHAHEDHLGAVQYLWGELGCPIYATPFTAAFLRLKMAESGMVLRMPIKEVACGSSLSLAPFEIELAPLTHSAPEMQALVIKTPHGNVFHTGDWKFDHDPLIGQTADEERLKYFGDQGVLALIGDSTNVFNPGVSGSEGDLRASLEQLIAGCEKMVAVTTFASNLARIETIIKAAEKCGRRVVIAGRSLWRVINAARDSGYLQDIQELVKDTEMNRFARNQLLVLCTGCQGEPLAATTKMANNSHPAIRLTPGDTVIFSSKIIPGNEKSIFRLFNQFVRLGVKVFTEKDHFVHVSGHPSRDELAKMYRLIRPQIAIPVHGEAVHLHEHVDYAKSLGVPQTFTVENGDVIKLAPGTAEHLGKVESGYLAIDGHYLLPIQSPVMQTRRKMRHAGIIIVNLIMTERGSLKVDPLIKSPGSLDPIEDKHFIMEMSDTIRDVVTNLTLNGRPKAKEELIKNAVRSTVRRMVKQEVGKQPVIDVDLTII